MNLTSFAIELMEHGWLPDLIARQGIRRLCRTRLEEERVAVAHDGSPRADFWKSLQSGPIALHTELANEQHYELPAEFFTAVLGPRRKYSCCFFPHEQTTLAEAEEAALALTCQRADLCDGQQVLELGCGWGSLSLWMAEHYPGSQITAVSNSQSQRKFIAAEATTRGLRNLQVLTADMNDFTAPSAAFDRVVSVEMFEHMRNYQELLDRIASWLKPQGKLFVHIFCHRNLAYPFETHGDGNWLGRHFFTGGMMPSADLLSRFNRSLTVTQQFSWNGRHYQRTAEGWLAKLDSRREELLPILANTYGSAFAARWFNRWRMFFLAVAELFGFARGHEWLVSHYLLEPTAAVALNQPELR